MKEVVGMFDSQRIKYKRQETLLSSTAKQQHQKQLLCPFEATKSNQGSQVNKVAHTHTQIIFNKILKYWSKIYMIYTCAHPHTHTHTHTHTDKYAHIHSHIQTDTHIHTHTHTHTHTHACPYAHIHTHT